MKAPPRTLLAPALLALMGGTALAQAPAAFDLSWGASAGVLHRRLVERDADGSRLVAESGPMLRLALDAQLRLAGGGALRAEGSLAGGRLDYDGQTQAGTPVNTRTDHRDLGLAIAWRPLAAAKWGEGWLVLHALQQRRDIASTATAGGLRETSMLLLPGVRWSHALDAGGWQWQPSIELRASARHRLDIDYLGVFDASELKGGRRRELALALATRPAGSPWQFSAEWTRSRQSASPLQPLYRGGVLVGTVHQPRIEIDDIALRVRRGF